MFSALNNRQNSRWYTRFGVRVKKKKLFGVKDLKKTQKTAIIVSAAISNLRNAANKEFL